MGFYRVGLNSKLKGLNNTESVLLWFKGFGRYKSRQSCGEKAAIVDKINTVVEVLSNDSIC